jgi:hypothetical protein
MSDNPDFSQLMVTASFPADSIISLLDQMIDAGNVAQISIPNDKVLSSTFRGRKVKICVALLVQDEGEAA